MKRGEGGLRENKRMERLGIREQRRKEGLGRGEGRLREWRRKEL